jgi:transglutaminase-like putative cysteine protease
MKYQISHTTSYGYSDPVSLCHNLLHLRPRECPYQVCLHDDLLVQPEPRAMRDHTDYFGNPATFFTIQEPHRMLKITAQALVDVTISTDALPESPAWELVRDALPLDKTAATLDAYQYVFDSRYVQQSDAVRDYAAVSFPPGRPLFQWALDLTRRIHADFRYDKRATTLKTPIAEVLIHRRGVCQDFANLQIGCLRSLGLAARYVSGYLVTKPPPGQERLIGADASHAWVAAFCPGLGWFEFDPTNDQVRSDRHITLAWGRDYDDVSPIKGIILGGGSHTMSVAVGVTPAA